MLKNKKQKKCYNNCVTEFINATAKAGNKNAFIVKPDFTCLEIDNSEEMTLEEMQNAVGGYIEYASYVEDENYDVVVNEESILLELPFNLLAYTITGYEFYGNVLFKRKERGVNDE